MELYARAAKCIGLGDLIDQRIRKNSSWSLLPTQVMRSFKIYRFFYYFSR